MKTGGAALEPTETAQGSQEALTGVGRARLATRPLLRFAVWAAVASGVLAWLIPTLWVSDPLSGSETRALAGFGVLLLEVFAFHGGLALLAIAPVALLARRRFAAVALLVLAAVHSGPGFAAALRSPAPIPTENPVLTVLSHNLLFSSASLDDLAAIVEAEQPDVIMLQEVVAARGHEILTRFSGEYPHHVWPATHRWGAVLLSRTPFMDREIVPGQAAWPIDQPAGVIEFSGTTITVMSVHLPAPNRLDQLVAGPQMSSRLAGWIGDRQAADPGAAMVLAGDFNAPLWASRMAVLRDAGLAGAHGAAGTGRGGTWPAHRGLGIVPGIRLDQAASVGPLRCVESRVLGSTGSDHRPILVRYARTPAGD